MRTAQPAPMDFLDSKRFAAALVWLLTFGVCYLAGIEEGARVVMPTVLAVVFLLSLLEQVSALTKKPRARRGQWVEPKKTPRVDAAADLSLLGRAGAVNRNEKAPPEESGRVAR
jgi:hypothetical protein